MGTSFTCAYGSVAAGRRLPGNGACATAVAAHICGYTPRKVTLELIGGTLQIEWRESDGHVLMTGPAAQELHRHGRNLGTRTHATSGSSRSLPRKHPNGPYCRHRPRKRRLPLRESMAELERLANTAGAEVVHTMSQRLDAPNPRTFIGAGKAEELARSCMTCMPTSSYSMTSSRLRSKAISSASSASP